MRRTGLLIPVRSAEDIVGDVRRRHNAVSVARRILPQTTMLFPIASHFSGFASFEAEQGDGTWRETARFELG